MQAVAGFELFRLTTTFEEFWAVLPAAQTILNKHTPDANVKAFQAGISIIFHQSSIFYDFFCVSVDFPMLLEPRQPMLLVDQLLAEPKLQSRALARGEHGQTGMKCDSCIAEVVSTSFYMYILKLNKHNI